LKKEHNDQPFAEEGAGNLFLTETESDGMVTYAFCPAFVPAPKKKGEGPCRKCGWSKALHEYPEMAVAYSTPWGTPMFDHAFVPPTVSEKGGT